jgi:hypothetical protein
MEKTTFESTVEGLREAAAEVADNATSTESVPGGKGGEHLPELHTGDQGDVGLPPAEDDGLSLKDAARRLADYRNQRETDRHNLNKAIGLDDPEQPADDDIQANYRRMKESVRQVEESLGIKDEQAERLEQLQHAQQELRAQLAEQQRSEDQPEVAQTFRQHAEAGRQQILSGFLHQYPEAYSTQAWEAMERDNPHRAAEAKRFFGRCQHIYQQHVNELAQAVPQHLEWRNSENQKWEEAHPEMKDSHVRQKVQEAAVKVLKRNGASDEDIRALAVNGLSFAAQQVLTDAAKLELAQEAKGKMNQGRRKVLPPPQRPGVAGAPRSRADAAVSAASRAMDQNPSAKNAARMLAAMRRSR